MTKTESVTGGRKVARKTPQVPALPGMTPLGIKPQPESVGDFKSRIAAIMRQRETGAECSIVGGPRADACVVRKEKTYGYNAWEVKK